MRAVVVDRLMEPAELGIVETDPPSPAADEVRIEVRAAGCNFSDVLMLRGEYQVRPPLPFIPGGEVAGVVTGRSAHAVSGFRSRGSGPVAMRARAGSPSEVAANAADDLSDARRAGLRGGSGDAGRCIRPRMSRWSSVRPLAGGRDAARARCGRWSRPRQPCEIGKALGARVIATAGGRREAGDRARGRGPMCTIDYRRG